MKVGAIFCDLQKAFGCVNHNILLTKFEFYGITGITYKLIKSYLHIIISYHIISYHIISYLFSSVDLYMITKSIWIWK